MQSTAGMKIVLTNLACKRAAMGGFGADDIRSTFDSPESITENRDMPGQYRLVGKGMTLVGIPEGEKFVVITCFKKKGL